MALRQTTAPASCSHYDSLSTYVVRQALHAFLVHKQALESLSAFGQEIPGQLVDTLPPSTRLPRVTELLIRLPALPQE